MADLTLLTVVQDVLGEMNSDNVNSISDTVEAEQVAGIAKRVFENICDEFDLPEQVTRVQLDASGDPAKPTHMTVQGTIVSMGRIKYDVRESVTDALKYQDIMYVTPAEFLDRSLALTSTDDNVMAVTDETLSPLLIYTDRAPTVWTSFDESTIIFDAYDSDVDTTLQTSKTVAMGRVRPTFVVENGYKIPLSNQIRSLYLNEVMSRAFLVLRQQTHDKAEQAARRLRTRLQRNKSKTMPPQYGPESGRSGPGSAGFIATQFRSGR